MSFNLPNLLTLSRIAAIPLMVGTFYIDGTAWRWVGCAVFTVAALTDWLDGYLARQRAEYSRFGEFLDPIADKLLVASALMMLVAFGRISGVAVLAALIILCREILVSGLREYLAELKVRMPVSRLAKWKTTLQMVAIGWLIVGDALPAIIYPVWVGEAMLTIAALLTIYTGYDYLRAGVKHLRSDVAREPAE